MVFEVSLTQDDDLFNFIHILVVGREAKPKQGPVNMSSYK